MLWAFGGLVCCSRVPRQRSEGVLAAFPATSVNSDPSNMQNASNKESFKKNDSVPNSVWHVINVFSGQDQNQEHQFSSWQPFHVILRSFVIYSWQNVLRPLSVVINAFCIYTSNCLFSTSGGKFTSRRSLHYSLNVYASKYIWTIQRVNLHITEEDAAGKNANLVPNTHQISRQPVSSISRKLSLSTSHLQSPPGTPKPACNNLHD